MWFYSRGGEHMKLLVTGGAGFIGSHLVETLLQVGHEVTSLDDLSSGQSENIVAMSNHPRFKFIQGSILDRDLVNRCIREHDAVFHLAAVVGVKYCIDNPLSLIASNVTGTEHVVEECHRFNKKLVLVSTSEVYGKSTELPFKEDGIRVFGSVTTSRWCYATTKTLDEYLALAYAQQGLQVTILRYFNIYGPRADTSQYASVVPSFIAAAIANRPITVHGDGTQTRCFTYVQDCVDGTIAALASSANGQIFNIGNSEETTIMNLAQTICSLVNSKSQIIQVPYDEVFGPGHEDIPRRVPDLSRAKAVIGYEPKVPLVQGLQMMVDWHRSRDQKPLSS